jgi:hypothetical protein
MTLPVSGRVLANWRLRRLCLACSICSRSFFFLCRQSWSGQSAIRRIRKSRGRLTGERLAITGIVIPMLALPMSLSFGRGLWRTDAGPVPNEFTMADLVRVRPENESSYELLCQLNDRKDDPNGAPAIGLSQADVDLLDSIHDSVFDPNSAEERLAAAFRHQTDIRRLWDKGQKGISVIHRLAEYEEIADLTEPALKTDWIASVDLRILSRLIHCRVLSEIGAGREQVIQELVRFDDLALKLSLTARPVIAKLVCYAILSGNRHTASLIFACPNTSEETLLSLAEHFRPLGEQHVSLKNSLIFDYSWFKEAIAEVKKMDKLGLTVKTNSSCRYYQAFLQKQISLDAGELLSQEFSPVSVWPWNWPNWPKVRLSEEDNHLILCLYNPVGQMMVQVTMPSAIKVMQIKTKIQITDDLLQWILARRLGREGSLKARAYGEAYVVDFEKNLVYSVGPDGEAFTQDDIKLLINPDVLGIDPHAD